MECHEHVAVSDAWWESMGTQKTINECGKLTDLAIMSTNLQYSFLPLTRDNWLIFDYAVTQSIIDCLLERMRFLKIHSMISVTWFSVTVSHFDDDTNGGRWRAMAFAFWYRANRSWRRQNVRQIRPFPTPDDGKTLGNHFGWFRQKSQLMSVFVLVFSCTAAIRD